MSDQGRTLTVTNQLQKIYEITIRMMFNCNPQDLRRRDQSQKIWNHSQTYKADIIYRYHSLKSQVMERNYYYRN